MKIVEIPDVSPEAGDILVDCRDHQTRWLFGVWADGGDRQWQSAEKAAAHRMGTCQAAGHRVTVWRCYNSNTAGEAVAGGDA
ncbi:MAG: hypothetical protein F4X93_00580 [Proteobacteria bacterium]|nr:hypothetical protein [Pseudomonadota bacterium]